MSAVMQSAPTARIPAITPAQKFTALLKDGYRPSIDEIALMLYELQSSVVDDEVRLWLGEKETPESLADALTKAQWLAGRGPRPVSDLRYGCAGAAA